MLSLFNTEHIFLNVLHLHAHSWTLPIYALLIIYLITFIRHAVLLLRATVQLLLRCCSDSRDDGNGAETAAAAACVVVVSYAYTNADQRHIVQRYTRSPLTLQHQRVSLILLSAKQQQQQQQQQLQSEDDALTAVAADTDESNVAVSTACIDQSPALAYLPYMSQLPIVNVQLMWQTLQQQQQQQQRQQQQQLQHNTFTVCYEMPFVSGHHSRCCYWCERFVVFVYFMLLSGVTVTIREGDSERKQEQHKAKQQQQQQLLLAFHSIISALFAAVHLATGINISYLLSRSSRRFSLLCIAVCVLLPLAVFVHEKELLYSRTVQCFYYGCYPEPLIVCRFEENGSLHRTTTATASAQILTATANTEPQCSDHAAIILYNATVPSLSASQQQPLLQRQPHNLTALIDHWAQHKPPRSELQNGDYFTMNANNEQQQQPQQHLHRMRLFTDVVVYNQHVYTENTEFSFGDQCGSGMPPLRRLPSSSSSSDDDSDVIDCGIWLAGAYTLNLGHFVTEFVPKIALIQQWLQQRQPELNMLQHCKILFYDVDRRRSNGDSSSEQQQTMAHQLTMISSFMQDALRLPASQLLVTGKQPVRVRRLFDAYGVYCMTGDPVMTTLMGQFVKEREAKAQLEQRQQQQQRSISSASSTKNENGESSERRMISPNAGSISGTNDSSSPRRCLVLLRRRDDRLLRNREQLLSALISAFPSVDVIEYEGPTELPRSQAETRMLMQRALVLVGMHGAGLANALLLPADAGVIEIITSRILARVFALQTAALAIGYDTVAATDDFEFDDNAYSYVVDVDAVVSAVKRMAGQAIATAANSKV